MRTTGLMVLSGVVCLALFLSSCSKRSADYEVLASRNIQCPAGSHLEFLPWGKSGTRATCIVENCPVAMAEDGYLRIEGQYAAGKEVGEWRWFDSSGKVVRTEQRGKE